MEKVADELIHLRNRAWTTSGARYNAARRLRTRGRLSLAVISLISAGGVALPLIAANPLYVSKADSFGLFSALLSLFILVVAVIETASGFDAKAETLYRNAEALNAFRLRINALLASTSAEQLPPNILEKHTVEYGQIRDTCSLNHELVDYDFFRVKHPKDFDIQGGWIGTLFVELRYALHSTWWLILIVLLSAWGFAKLVYK